MQDVYQKTISNSKSFEGIGLHSGKKSKITILPGKDDQGIVFKRIDLKQNNYVKANYESVSSAKLCTTLENDHGVKVSTVEHLLAALYIVGVDNAIIEIDNEEVPIMDGSAKDFLEVLNKSETISLTKKRKYLKIIDKVELIDGERKISIEPSEFSFEVDFQLNYENKIIGKQRNNVNFYTDNLDDVSKSRTFCLFEDIEKIKKIGLAKGGSLENAVVVDDNNVLNKDGLRNEKEFVNHKILDLAGDFLLSGHRVLGKVFCYQGGHELTNMFLRKLLSSKLAFKNIELENEKTEFSKKKIFDQPAKLAVSA
jgi:UDP-3-O-[3-hydroxymyristoyl] N-acetylglucosamine deacetylase